MIYEEGDPITISFNKKQDEVPYDAHILLLQVTLIERN